MRRQSALPAAILILMTAFSAWTDQSELVGLIIVNKSVSVDFISRTDLRNIYMGNRGNWENGVSIKPCYPGNEDELQSRFFDRMVGTTFGNFKKQWLRLVFAGYRSAPLKHKAPKNTVQYVQKNSGAIGIIPASWEGSLDGCRIIMVDSTGGF